MSSVRVPPVVLGGVLVFSILCSSGLAGDLAVGDLAPDFTLDEFGTNDPVSLYDFRDEIVLLDFFAWWCGPCRTASSELGPYIQKYYEARGGNPSGIPVQIISLNIQGGADEETQEYIDEYGLELVLDDSGRSVYSRYSSGYIPRFAIINGAAPANYDRWEILFLDHGYSSGGYNEFRSIIDGVVLIPEPATLWLLAAGVLAGIIHKGCHGRLARP